MRSNIERKKPAPLPKNPQRRRRFNRPRLLTLIPPHRNSILAVALPPRSLSAAIRSHSLFKPAETQPEETREVQLARHLQKSSPGGGRSGPAQSVQRQAMPLVDWGKIGEVRSLLPFAGPVIEQIVAPLR